MVPDDEMYDYSCEDLGTCDDSCSPPARGDCLVAETAEPVEALPHTGADPLLALTALISLTIGLLLARQRLEH